MHTLLLFADSLCFTSMEEFTRYIDNMLVVCTEDKTDHDNFVFHHTIWGHETGIGAIVDLFYNLAPDEYKIFIIPKILQLFHDCESVVSNVGEMNVAYPQTNNGFIGFDFNETDIEKELQVCDSNSFNLFKQHYAVALGQKAFWPRRTILFPDLVLCNDVEAQVAKLGGSKYLLQSIDKLKELNTYAKNWLDGDFDYHDVTAKHPLVISPESEHTLAKYSSERTFSLPNGTKEIFDLHIKAGDIRIHFFPDNENHKIYIGYIGMHLPIVSEK